MSQHQYQPELGKLIEKQEFRDAVHLAVAPVTAGETLHPGQRVGLNRNMEAVSPNNMDVEYVGIVDPFLECGEIYEGQKFWLVIHPYTITGLRHAWTHKAFRPTLNFPVPRKADERAEQDAEGR